MTRVGAALFALGTVSTLVTVGLWLITGRALGVWAYYLAIMMPLGFALIGWDLVKQIRRKARTTKEFRAQ